MKILGGLQVSSVDLNIATEGTASDVRRERDPGAATSQNGIVAPIKDDAAQDFTLHRGTLFRPYLFRDAGLDVENIDILEAITERRIGVGEEGLPHFSGDTEIPLIVNGAEIIRFRKESLSA